MDMKEAHGLSWRRCFRRHGLSPETMKKEVAPTNGGLGAPMCGSNADRRTRRCDRWKELNLTSGDDEGMGAARVATVAKKMTRAVAYGGAWAATARSTKSGVTR